MTLDPLYTEEVETRLEDLEMGLHDAFVYLHNCLSKEQMNRVRVYRQQEMASILSRLDALEADVQDLHSKYDALL
jgi:polyhydroxyalkanoate synthesis regulator phasin